MRKEFRRQFLHYFFGCTVIILVGLAGAINYAVISAGVIMIGFSVSSMVKKGIRVPLFSAVIDYAGRKEEEKLPGRGAIVFFASTLLSSILFFQNPSVLIGALIVLVFGDSLATIIGKFAGTTKIYNKRTLEGTIAGIIISFVYLCLLFEPGIAILTAIIGMSAEFIPLNDNITIPLVSGLALTLLI